MFTEKSNKGFDKFEAEGKERSCIVPQITSSKLYFLHISSQGTTALAALYICLSVPFLEVVIAFSLPLCVIPPHC